MSGRRLYLCEWCEDHHFREIPYPPGPPVDNDDHNEHCQRWCET